MNMYIITYHTYMYMSYIMYRLYSCIMYPSIIPFQHLHPPWPASHLFQKYQPDSPWKCENQQRKPTKKNTTEKSSTIFGTSGFSPKVLVQYPRGEWWQPRQSPEWWGSSSAQISPGLLHEHLGRSASVQRWQIKCTGLHLAKLWKSSDFLGKENSNHQ